MSSLFLVSRRVSVVLIEFISFLKSETSDDSFRGGGVKGAGDRVGTLSILMVSEIDIFCSYAHLIASCLSA